MGTEQPNYNERFAEVQRELYSGTDEAFRNATSLLREVYGSSNELIQGLQDEVNALRNTFDTSGNNGSAAALELKDVFDAVRGKLNTLRATLGPVPGENPEEDDSGKAWYTRLFNGGMKGIGKSYAKITTAIAFSLGGFLKSVKESGFFKAGEKDKEGGLFNWSKLLQPLMAMVGMDKIELASAMQNAGFEGIDANSGNFGSVKLVLQTRPELKGMTMETFAALLATAAKEKYPNKPKISYKELEMLAKNMEVPEVARPEQTTPTEEPTTKSEAPSEVVNTGTLLGDYVDILGEPVGVVAAGTITVGSRKWLMRTPDRKQLSVTAASVEAGGKLHMTVSVEGKTYDWNLNEAELKLLVAEMKTKTEPLNQQILRATEGSNLNLEIVPQA